MGPTGAVNLFNISSKKVETTTFHQSEGYGLAWTSGKLPHFFTAASDSQVVCWDSAQGLKVLKAYKGKDGRGFNDLCIDHKNESVAYTAGESKAIDVWDTRSEKGCATYAEAHDGEVMAVDANTFHEHLLLSGGADGVGGGDGGASATGGPFSLRVTIG